MIALDRILKVAAIAGSLAMTACASHYNAPSERAKGVTSTFRIEDNLRFSPPNWPQALYADLYLPDLATSAPAVMLVHGGGWERRSRQDMGWIAERLASQGFAVMNIDYRFAPDHTFPAQLHDLQIAMRWLRQQAPQYRINPEAIGAFGFSSGAHLVSLLALTSGDRHPLSEPYGGNPVVPVAVVAGGLPSDLRRFDSGPLIRQFLGGRQQDIPDTYRLASPLAQVARDAPPFFLFHGGMDLLVPLEQAEEFHQALQRLNVDSELYVLHLRGHLSSFLTAGPAVDRAADFLRRHTLNPNQPTPTATAGETAPDSGTP